MICHRAYPPDTKGSCPDDQGELFADSLIGTVFAEKYLILSLLGEGGMSQVYKARHTLMNRTVAIKLLYDCARDSVARARFQQEAEAASALSHPNVVTVHDFGLTAAGQPYFIMDCLEGKSLADLLAEKRFLKIQQAIEVFTQTCEGLDHAHRKGIIHRDIKPSNIIIIKQDDGYDLIKLVDFGIAKLMPTGSQTLKQKRITQTGEVFGTPAYMSPEQCNGRSLDARSDIYSFGCLMYETLAGQPPFIADTFVATVVKHVNDLPQPLSEKALIKVPPSLETVIMKCLEKDPDKRYHSASELKQALLDAAFVSGLKGLRVGAVPEPRSLGISGSGTAPDINLPGAATKRLRMRNRLITASLLLPVLFAGCWVVFFYKGPEGDLGTAYDKLRWQIGIAQADQLIRNRQYAQAASSLEATANLAKSSLQDSNRRLEFTLNRLVDAYEGSHNSEKVEEVNKQLARLEDEHTDREYASLMMRLKSWEKPTTSSVQWEERAQQAAAFAERISRCADQMAARSKKKEEELLNYAARTYDILNLREGIFRTSFRIKLAEIYRAEHRSNEERAILEEALEHSAVDPQTEMGWRCKIKVSLLTGEMHYTVFEHDRALSALDKARNELDNALSWTRAHLPADRELLGRSLNSSAQTYAAYHKKEFAQKAKLLQKEADRLKSG